MWWWLVVVGCSKAPSAVEAESRPDRVAVVAVDRLSGAPEPEGLAAGLAELLGLELRARGVDVVSRHPWEITDPTPAVEVSVQCGLVALGPMLRLDCRLVPLADAPVIGAAGVQGSLPEAWQLTRQIADQLAPAVGGGGTAEPPTRSTEAVQALGRALDAWDDPDAARGHLDAALAADPDLARARELRARLD